MSDLPSLEQWQLLAAVVDAGGFAQAADQLCKSQSAVSYGIKQLQAQVGVPLLRMDGRKAVLSDEGELLLKRARALLQQADDLQQFAARISQHQPKLIVSVESLLPLSVVSSALAEVLERYPDTHIELDLTVLSGGVESLLARRVDLAVVAELPPGFIGSTFIDIPLVLVAAPQHALVAKAKQQVLSFNDLVRERQVVIRDSGLKRNRDAGWLGAQRRITVSSLAASLQMVSSGLGFAWLPRYTIARELEQGVLVELPLNVGAERRVPLFVVHTEPAAVPPAQALLAQAIVRHAQRLR